MTAVTGNAILLPVNMCHIPVGIKVTCILPVGNGSKGLKLIIPIFDVSLMKQVWLKRFRIGFDSNVGMSILLKMCNDVLIAGTFSVGKGAFEKETLLSTFIGI